MLRKLALTAFFTAGALALLWVAHEFVPGISGLGDLNDLAGIGSFALAVVGTVLLFAPRDNGAASQVAGDSPGTAQQASAGSAPIAQSAAPRPPRKAEAGNTEAMLKFAALLERQGRVDEAADVYQRAIHLGETGAMLKFAALLERQGRLDEAADVYQRAIELGETGATE